MKKNVFYSCVIAAMIILLVSGSIYGSSLKTSELNRKIAEISSLQHSISSKISQAKDMREQLKQQTEELTEEIKEEKERIQIASFQKAIQNPRINNDLKLIQKLLGYITRLNEKISYFMIGNETLNFYFQQVQDDLLMIKTLNDLEVDKLIAQINSVLDEYVLETNKPMFDVNDAPLHDTEKIWNEIIN